MTGYFQKPSIAISYELYANLRLLCDEAIDAGELPMGNEIIALLRTELDQANRERVANTELAGPKPAPHYTVHMTVAYLHRLHQLAASCLVLVPEVGFLKYLSGICHDIGYAVAHVHLRGFVCLDVTTEHCPKCGKQVTLPVTSCDRTGCSRKD